MPDVEKVIKGLEVILEETADMFYRSIIQDALVLLKAQEHPTDASISSAIECLLHPQDADDSDMAKAIDTAVRAMRLLKAQEPAEPVVDIDTWKCGKCGHTLEHQVLLGDNVLFH